MLHVVFASDENQVEGAPRICICVFQACDVLLSKFCCEAWVSFEKSLQGGLSWLPTASLMKGVQASVASVVSATASPDELTIHIIVQARSLNTFKDMGS